jgi:hypothetical protein
MELFMHRFVVECLNIGSMDVIGLIRILALDNRLWGAAASGHRPAPPVEL